MPEAGVPGIGATGLAGAAARDVTRRPGEAMQRKKSSYQLYQAVITVLYILDGTGYASTRASSSSEQTHDI